jgi:hypothetical protein
MIKPIKEQELYYFKNGKLFAVPSMEEITIKKDSEDIQSVTLKYFFKSNEELFFNVIETYVVAEGEELKEPVEVQYQQRKGVVTKLEKEIKIEERTGIELEKSPFKIVTGSYEEEPISEVYQGTLQINFYLIPLAKVIDGDLFYWVSESLRTRPKGLYVWKNGASSPDLLKSDGELW